MARRAPSPRTLAAMERVLAIVERYMNEGEEAMPKRGAEGQQLVTIMDALTDAYSAERVLDAMAEVCDRRVASLSAEAYHGGDRAWRSLSAAVHKAAQVAARGFIIVPLLCALAVAGCAGRPSPMERCLSYGYEPGTEAMATCIMFTTEGDRTRAAAWWTGQMRQWQ